MEGFDQLMINSDPLLLCSLCNGCLSDAVQLTCLHNYCQSCFDDQIWRERTRGVSCKACGSFTKLGSEQSNGFIRNIVDFYFSIQQSRMCSVCEANDKDGEPASIWCPKCRCSLCEDCIPSHRRMFPQHETKTFDDIQQVAELASKPSRAHCSTHEKPLKTACLNCKKLTCTVCNETCEASGHNVLTIIQKEFDTCVKQIVTSTSADMHQLQLKAENLFKKPRQFMDHIKVAERRHLEELNKRNQDILDMVKKIHREAERSIKNVYDHLQKKVEEDEETSVALSSDLSDAENYIKRLHTSNELSEIFAQQKAVHERLKYISAKMDTLNNSMPTMMAEVSTNEPRPEDVRKSILEFFELPLLVYPARTLPYAVQPYPFGAATFTSSTLPRKCLNVAVTKEGSVLIAAQKDGLLEICPSSGRQLSCWLPHNRKTKAVEQVMSVASLDDGRAAVCLFVAQLVVLLRRNKHFDSTAGAASATDWIEDERLNQLPWAPDALSVHGQLAAVIEFQGIGLQLMRLISGDSQSCPLNREYIISCVALTSLVVVTGSRDKVVPWRDGLLVQVLDAHSVALDCGEDRRLWRHALDSRDGYNDLKGVCADSIGGCLYFSVWNDDRDSGRLYVLRLTDGRQLHCLALESELICRGLSLPVLPTTLSLREEATIGNQDSRGRVLLLAVLSMNRQTRLNEVLTVHRSCKGTFPHLSNL